MSERKRKSQSGSTDRTSGSEDATRELSKVSSQDSAARSSSGSSRSSSRSSTGSSSRRSSRDGSGGSRGKSSGSRKKSLGRKTGKQIGQLTDGIENFFKRVTRGIGEILSMLFSIVVPKSVLKKLEPKAGTGSSKLGKQVGEISDQFEKSFTKGAAGVWEVLSFLTKILVPRFVRTRVAKLSKAISKRFSRFWRRLGKGISSAAERYLPKWLLNLIKASSKWTKRTTRNAGRFIAAYWKSRDYMALAWSTPAILLAIPLAGALVLTQIYSVNARIRHYTAALQDVGEIEGLDEAAQDALSDLLMQKLNQLGFSRAELFQYQEALVKAREDDLEGAYETMREIAPFDLEQPGLVYAHIWIAEQLIEEKIEADDEDQRWELIEQHAIAARARPGGKDDTAVTYIEMKVHEHKGESRQARLKMEQIIDEYPALNAELWSLHLGANNVAAARGCARAFSRYCESEATKELTEADYAVWAAMQETLGDVKEAQRISQLGLEKFGESDLMRKMGAVVVIAQLKRLPPRDPEVIALLRKGHEIDPENPDIIYMIAARLSSPAERYAIEPTINEMKTAGTLSAVVILTAGDNMVRYGDPQQALKFYTESTQIDPKYGRAWNNIAWLFANAFRPPNLPVALSRVNEALKLEQDETFYETRGLIYYRMGRPEWDNAANDLERALYGDLSDEELHRAHSALADIYRYKKQSDLADLHAEQAEFHQEKGMEDSLKRRATKLKY